eukprot:SAG31_NODE_1536_length_7983_cov_4.341071_3_plen_1072_part_00
MLAERLRCLLPLSMLVMAVFSCHRNIVSLGYPYCFSDVAGANEARNFGIVRGKKIGPPDKGDGWGDLYCPAHYTDRVRECETSLLTEVQQSGDPEMIAATESLSKLRMECTIKESDSYVPDSVQIAYDKLIRVYDEPKPIDKKVWEDAFAADRARVEKKQTAEARRLRQLQKIEAGATIQKGTNSTSKPKPVRAGNATTASSGEEKPEKRISKLKLRQDLNEPQTAAEAKKQLEAALRLSRDDPKSNQPQGDSKRKECEKAPRKISLLDDSSSDEDGDDSDDDWDVEAERRKTDAEEAELNLLESLPTAPKESTCRSKRSASCLKDANAGRLPEGDGQLRKKSKNDPVPKLHKFDLSHSKKTSKNDIGSGLSNQVRDGENWRSNPQISKNGKSIDSSGTLSSTVAVKASSSAVARSDILAVPVVHANRRHARIHISDSEEEDDDIFQTDVPSCRSTVPRVVPDSAPIVYEESDGRDTLVPQAHEELAEDHLLSSCDQAAKPDLLISTLEAHAQAAAQNNALKQRDTHKSKHAGGQQVSDAVNLKRRKRCGKCGACRCCRENIWRCELPEHKGRTKEGCGINCSESQMSCCRDPERCIHNNPEFNKGLSDENFMDQDDDRVDVNDPESDFAEIQEMSPQKKAMLEQRYRAEQRRRREDERWRIGQQAKKSKRQQLQKVQKNEAKNQFRTMFQNPPVSRTSAYSARGNASAPVRDTTTGQMYESFSAMPCKQNQDWSSSRTLVQSHQGRQMYESFSAIPKFQYSEAEIRDWKEVRIDSPERVLKGCLERPFKRVEFKGTTERGPHDWSVDFDDNPYLMISSKGPYSYLFRIYDSPQDGKMGSIRNGKRSIQYIESDRQQRHTSKSTELMRQEAMQRQAQRKENQAQRKENCGKVAEFQKDRRDRAQQKREKTREHQQKREAEMRQKQEEEWKQKREAQWKRQQEQERRRQKAELDANRRQMQAQMAAQMTASLQQERRQMEQEMHAKMQRLENELQQRQLQIESRQNDPSDLTVSADSDQIPDKVQCPVCMELVYEPASLGADHNHHAVRRVNRAFHLSCLRLMPGLPSCVVG